MNSTQAAPGTIERPRLWRLALQLDHDALRAVVWSTVEDSSLHQFVLPLDPTLSLQKGLEEAVYATPVLLSDFGGVDVVVRTDAFMTAPSGFDSDFQRSLLEYSCMAAGDVEVMADEIHGADADILWSVDGDTGRFLARTFRNPHLHCHISPLLRFFGRRSLLGNSGKLYVHFHQGAMIRQIDIIVFGDDGRLALASTHDCPSDDDALYYILASAREAGLDVRSDEILLCGSASARDSMMPLLRRYAGCVMPVIFPSAAFRAGKEALNAPFPLVILPLCE